MMVSFEEKPIPRGRSDVGWGVGGLKPRLIIYARVGEVEGAVLKVDRVHKLPLCLRVISIELN